MAKKRKKKVHIEKFQGNGSGFVKGAKKKIVEKRLDKAEKELKASK